MKSRHSVPMRLGFALPDALTAATFALIWVSPMTLGDGAVRGAMLLMLIEFVLVHATGFIGMFAFEARVSRRRRLMAMAGFAVFYLGFVTAFALIFDALWPFWAFGWLLLSKVAVVLDRKDPDAARQQRMQLGWGLSVVAYICGVLLTVLLPIPRLGMSETLQPQFGIPGSGLWVEQPQRVIAFGLLYYGFLAWAKWQDWDPGVVTKLPRKR